MRIKSVFVSLIERFIFYPSFSKNDIYDMLKIVEGGLSPSKFKESQKLRNEIYGKLMSTDYYEKLFMELD